jgi:flagellar protein FliS
MNPYFEQKILSVDPIELIRLVYQRARSSVADAREHLRNKRILERSAAINRAYMAIHELKSALQPEVAPELCGRLQSLYLYMQKRLLEANMRQEDAPLAEVLKLLTTLEEGWSGVAKELAAGREQVHETEPRDRRNSHLHEMPAAPTYALTA